MAKGESFKVDPFNNITYGSTKTEHVTTFSFDAGKSYPIRVEMIGVTNPDKDYYIERKHSDYYVFEYVVAGKGYVVSEGKRYEVGAGDVYILEAGSGHKYGADKKQPYTKIWINFFSGIMRDLLVAYGLSGKVVFHDERCLEHFKKLIEYSENHPYNEEYSTIISKILMDIVLSLSEKQTEEEKVSVIALSVKERLDSSVYRKVTVDSLTKELNVSKSQMTREFKKYYGQTPYNYLLEKRFSLAKHLLVATQMKVCDIAEALCFSDEYNFSNAFKNKVGVSPARYRATQREGEK